MVVGSETGILNAAAHMAMPKIVFLSHSSAHNLTKHWVNSFPVTPVGVDCYPCQRLHYGMKFCREDAETGCAQCQMSIAPARVSAPIIEAYQAWEEETREAA